VEKFGWQFRPRDKVIQTENDYDKDVFNGDIGQIVKIAPLKTRSLSGLTSGRLCATTAN
jgi:ATP-dependent exoDNAse (exonuclease V) alpha subunit